MLKFKILKKDINYYFSYAEGVYGIYINNYASIPFKQYNKEISLESIYYKKYIFRNNSKQKDIYFICA